MRNIWTLANPDLYRLQDDGLRLPQLQPTRRTLVSLPGIMALRSGSRDILSPGSPWKHVEPQLEASQRTDVRDQARKAGGRLESAGLASLK